MRRTSYITAMPFSYLRTLLGSACLVALSAVSAGETVNNDACVSRPQSNKKEASIRGVWLASPDHNRFFDNPDTMRQQVSAWKQQGINTVFVAMWNQGRTLYPSAVVNKVTAVPIDARFAGRDPLQELIQVVRQEGLKVYAWFEFGFASDYKGGLGSELIDKRPHWAARDRHGDFVIKNGFRWMNAMHPEVQNFVLDIVTEVVDRYDVDGVQGDDRLPAMPSEGGYDSDTVARYRLAHGGTAPPQDPKNAKWLQWRAEELNHFVQRLHADPVA